MLIIAHRGASAQAPENTLAAIRRAWELGADGVEIDVHLTRDGIPVVIHDADTVRVAGKKRVVSRSTLKELKALDVGKGFDEAFSGERIPTLEEVLAIMPPRKYLFIEAKEAPAAQLAKALMPIFEQHPKWIANRQILFMSFFPDLLWSAATKFPDLTLLLLLDDKRRLPRRLPKRLPSDSLPVHGMGISHKLMLRDEEREALIGAGALMNVWTVNDPAMKAHWEHAGFDFLTTDLPELFITPKPVLAEK